MADDPPTGSEGPLSSSIRVPPANPVMPQPGDLFAGRYEIESLLGRGGMGEVYAAVQRPLGRRVAVKILKPPESIEDDPNFQDRFLREAAAAARLTHPNTITVFDFGQTDEGVLYIVMEYLEGSDVRTVLRHEGTISPHRAVHVAKQVCKSLREAHRKGIVHRDLKPANVLILERADDPDFAKVLDFGLVKFRDEASELTLAGKFLGSPRYTSPEALDRNKEVDHRADIYAVGILLYAMIVGRPPFDGDPMQVLNAHLNEQPRPMWKAAPATKTTPELERTVARCLQKDPERRFQSMTELLIALRKVGAYYGHHDTQTVDMEIDEESIDLDESVPSATSLAPLTADEDPVHGDDPDDEAPTDPMLTVEWPKKPDVAVPSHSNLPALFAVVGLATGIVAFLLRPTPEPVDTMPTEVSTPAPEATPEAAASTPDPTPSSASEPTPEATPTTRPRPASSPGPRPEATPRPTPLPTTEAKDEALPSGYKSNPYD